MASFEFDEVDEFEDDDLNHLMPRISKVLDDLELSISSQQLEAYEQVAVHAGFTSNFAVGGNAVMHGPRRQRVLERRKRGTGRWPSNRARVFRERLGGTATALKRDVLKDDDGLDNVAAFWASDEDEAEKTSSTVPRHDKRKTLPPSLEAENCQPGAALSKRAVNGKSRKSWTKARHRKGSGRPVTRREFGVDLKQNASMLEDWEQEELLEESEESPAATFIAYQSHEEQRRESILKLAQQLQLRRESVAQEHAKLASHDSRNDEGQSAVALERNHQEEQNEVVQAMQGRETEPDDDWADQVLAHEGGPGEGGRVPQIDSVQENTPVAVADATRDNGGNLEPPREVMDGTNCGQQNSGQQDGISQATRGRGSGSGEEQADHNRRNRGSSRKFGHMSQTPNVSSHTPMEVPEASADAPAISAALRDHTTYASSGGKNEVREALQGRHVQPEEECAPEAEGNGDIHREIDQAPEMHVSVSRAPLEHPRNGAEMYQAARAGLSPLESAGPLFSTQNSTHSTGDAKQMANSVAHLVPGTSASALALEAATKEVHAGRQKLVFGSPVDDHMDCNRSEDEQGDEDFEEGSESLGGDDDKLGREDNIAEEDEASEEDKTDLEGDDESLADMNENFEQEGEDSEESDEDLEDEEENPERVEQNLEQKDKDCEEDGENLQGEGENVMSIDQKLEEGRENREEQGNNLEGGKGSSNGQKRSVDQDNEKAGGPSVGQRQGIAKANDGQLEHPQANLTLKLPSSTVFHSSGPPQEATQEEAGGSDMQIDEEESASPASTAPSQPQVEKEARESARGKAACECQEKPNVRLSILGRTYQEPLPWENRVERGESSKQGYRRRAKSRQSLAGAGLKWENGVRRSSRTRLRPLEYWRNEKMTYGRNHMSLPTIQNIVMANPDPLWPLPSGRKKRARPLPSPTGWPVLALPLTPT